jgi:hypothetical protein
MAQLITVIIQAYEADMFRYWTLLQAKAEHSKTQTGTTHRMPHQLSNPFPIQPPYLTTPFQNNPC